MQSTSDINQSKSLIIHLITSLRTGGAQEVLKTLCAETQRDYEHKIFYVVGDNEYSSDDSLASAKELGVVGLFNLIKTIGYLSRLLKVNHSLVCVQGWMYHGNLLALLVKFVSPRTPVIFSIHNGSDCWEFSSSTGFLASRICALFSGMAKASIFVSNKSLTCHVPYKNSIVIPNPIKPLKLANDGVGSESEVSATLAFVSRFDPIKNIGFMLDVMQGLRTIGLPVRILMAGGGMSAMNGVLKEMIESRNLNHQVELLGVVSDISSVYKRADYTILTSKCESFSNVLLESIACGTPFISSDVGIATDLLSPESSVIQGYELRVWVDRLSQILKIRKTSSISQSVSRHYERVAGAYAPARIARLYSDCWARAIAR